MKLFVCKAVQCIQMFISTRTSRKIYKSNNLMNIVSRECLFKRKTYVGFGGEHVWFCLVVKYIYSKFHKLKKNMEKSVIQDPDVT